MKPRPVTLIDAALLDATTAKARASARRRMNHNFHPLESDPANRLLNAIEPGSYVTPHRHLDSAKDETFVVLRGRFGLVCFDGQGRVTQTLVLDAGGPVFGADVPSGTFHTLISLAPGSVFFEVKAGPYEKMSDKDWAPWAPREGEAGAGEYLARLETLFG
jgi:cupin fold WbuC family metalloprotein